MHLQYACVAAEQTARSLFAPDGATDKGHTYATFYIPLYELYGYNKNLERHGTPFYAELGVHNFFLPSENLYNGMNNYQKGFGMLWNCYRIYNRSKAKLNPKKKQSVWRAEEKKLST